MLYQILEFGTNFVYKENKFKVVGQDIAKMEIEAIKIPFDEKYYWFKILNNGTILQLCKLRFGGQLMDEMKTAYDENGIPYLVEAEGSEALYIINLIIRDTAKEINKEVGGRLYGACPMCSRLYQDKTHVLNFCDNCGQRLIH